MLASNQIPGTPYEETCDTIMGSCIIKVPKGTPITAALLKLRDNPDEFISMKGTVFEIEEAKSFVLSKALQKYKGKEVFWYKLV